MADVFDKINKRLLKSVNTPDFMTEQYIINPKFVPDCESKYIVVEPDDTIREMTIKEKGVVDYVAPPPEPTPAQIEATRQSNIQTEINKTHSFEKRMEIIQKALKGLLPEDTDIKGWDDAVIAAKVKYPKK